MFVVYISCMELGSFSFPIFVLEFILLCDDADVANSIVYRIQRVNVFRHSICPAFIVLE